MARNDVADTQAARELRLWARNTPELYAAMQQAARVIHKHSTRGVYNEELALRVTRRIAADAAKRYAADSAGDTASWGRLFSVATRELAARELLADVREMIEIGDMASPARGAVFEAESRQVAPQRDVLALRGYIDGHDNYQAMLKSERALVRSFGRKGVSEHDALKLPRRIVNYAADELESIHGRIFSEAARDEVARGLLADMGFAEPQRTMLRRRELSNVSSKYGAPMGRAEALPEDLSEPIKVSLARVRIDRGGYDSGGAYWGLGAPLYRATSDDDAVDLFVRGASKELAQQLVLNKVPGAYFGKKPSARKSQPPPAKQQAYEVLLDNMLTEIVFYDADMGSDEVRDQLVKREGYPSNIVVRRRRTR